MQLDPEALADIVANAIDIATAPLLARITVLEGHKALVLSDGRVLVGLEQRILELETKPESVGPMGQKGDPGIGIASLVISAEGRLVAHLTDGRSLDVGPVPLGPPGKDGAIGEKGLDGKDGAPGLNGKDGAIGPQGKDGAPGLNGKDGSPGDRGLTGEKGLDGLHGRDGRDGAPGLPGMPGEKGLDGKDGRDGADGLHGKDGSNGLNGKDGADGLGFDDFDLVLDEARGWILRLAQGERVKEIGIPIPFFRGNWEAGVIYPKGAGVRWEGHYWWALAQTSDQPGEASKTWALVISRGKQGKEGRAGKDAPALRQSNTPPLYGG